MVKTKHLFICGIAFLLSGTLNGLSSYRFSGPAPWAYFLAHSGIAINLYGLKGDEGLLALSSRLPAQMGVVKKIRVSLQAPRTVRTNSGSLKVPHYEPDKADSDETTVNCCASIRKLGD